MLQNHHSWCTTHRKPFHRNRQAELPQFWSFSLAFSQSSSVQYPLPEIHALAPLCRLPVTKMASLIYMPLRGEETAPAFNKEKPCKFPRFFDELESLFDRTSISDDVAKKCHVLQYVDFEIERLWKALPEFWNASSSYADFRRAIILFYLEAYSFSDLNLLIKKYQKSGIKSIADLSSYHMKFLSVTSWLIDNYQLDTLKQQQIYIHVFQPQFVAEVTSRLQIKKPNHHPTVPHPIKDVYDAAQHVL